ncbi:MAG TPA: Lsr2 family protein [Pseudonocardiaceae bacterium]|nr:Lsr2 family protein [Pseudonocardiaceae bacterium]
MVRRFVVVFEDDLTGGKAAETVGFGLDGTAYEIDLSAENARRLRATLQPYVVAARRSDRGRTPNQRRPRSERERVAAIRSWARGNGWEVSERGRLPVAVVDGYYAAARPARRSREPK